MADLGTIGFGQTGPQFAPLDTPLAGALVVAGYAQLAQREPVTFFPSALSTIYQVRGFMKDSAGVGVARRIFAFDETSEVIVGSTVSSAVDGSFTFDVAYDDHLITIFNEPELGEDRNGVLLSNLQPVLYVPPVVPVVIPEALAIYNSLTAWWDFEQNNAGAQFNDSHGVNHMVILPTLPTSALSGTGQVGRGFKPGHFTGYAGIIPYTNANLRFPNSNFSFGGWVAGGNLGGWSAFMGGRVGSALGGIQAYLNIDSATNFICFTASTDGTAQVSASSGMTSDTVNPALVIATFDRTNNLLRIRTRRFGSANTNVTAAFPSPLYTTVTDVNFALNAGVSNDNTLFSGTRSLGGTPLWDSWFYCTKALTDGEVDYLFSLGAGKNYATLATDAGH